MTSDTDSPADIQAMARQALAELSAIFDALGPDQAERMCDEIVRARRIACYGAGREGLMIRALCMRLMHLGLDAHMVAEMTTPPIGAGDLLIASVGPGELAVASAFLDVAKRVGARTLVVTAQPGGSTSRQADTIIYLPAQTMADDLSGGTSILPMGTAFEIAQLLFFDLVSILLRNKTNQTAEQMRARHTNLE